MSLRHPLLLPMAAVATLTLLLVGVAGQGLTPININGGWSPWSTISTPCLRENALGEDVEVTCGGGMQTRIRSCTNPRPQVRTFKDCLQTWRTKANAGFFKILCFSTSCFFIDLRPWLYFLQVAKWGACFKHFKSIYLGSSFIINTSTP